MLTQQDLEAIAPDACVGKSADALKLACDSALGFAEIHCNRRFTAGTFTEDYDGPGHEKINLRNWPLISVTSVKVDLNVPPAFGTDTIISSDLYIVDADSGQIILRSNLGTVQGVASSLPIVNLWGGRHYSGMTPYPMPPVWPRGYKIVRVAYLAGYQPTHRHWNAIRGALIELATYFLKYASSGGVAETSVSYIDVSKGIGFLQSQQGRAPIASALAVLDKLKEIPMGNVIF